MCVNLKATLFELIRFIIKPAAPRMLAKKRTIRSYKKCGD